MRTMPIDHHAVDEIEMMTTPTPIRLQAMPRARTWNDFYKLAKHRTNILQAHSKHRQTETYLTGLIFFGGGENY